MDTEPETPPRDGSSSRATPGPRSSPCGTRWPRSSSARRAPCPAWSPPSWSAATSCSRACPAWPRRCWSRPWPPRSTSSSNGSSSRPTSCRPTWSARSSSTGSGPRSRSAPARCSPTCCLADEINRTPPKTQAALLESMEERQVSVEGEPRPLPEPFVVVATQNPVEYEGTYPLPEAQLDRFLFKLQVGYPTLEQEQEVLARHDRGLDPHDLVAAGVRAVASAADLDAARRQVDLVRVEPPVLAYIVGLARATRESPSVTLGVSPRGAAYLLHAAKAWAWLAGRSFVTPDEVKAVVKPTLRHRILHPARARARGHDGRRHPRRHPRHRPRPPLRPVPLPTRRLGLVALLLAAVRAAPSGAGERAGGRERRPPAGGGDRLAAGPGAGAHRRRPAVPRRGHVAGHGRAGLAGEQPDDPPAADRRRRRAGPVAAGAGPAGRDGRAGRRLGDGADHDPTGATRPLRPRRDRRADLRPAGSGRAAAHRRHRGRLRIYPAVPVEGRGRVADHQGAASSRSACGRPRAGAVAPSSSSCGSGRPTTSSAGSTGRPPPAPTSRSSAPTGPSATRP